MREKESKMVEVACRTFVEREVEHGAELFAVHESVGVEERGAAGLAGEVLHSPHGGHGLVLVALAVPNRLGDAVNTEVKKHGVVMTRQHIALGRPAELPLHVVAVVIDPGRVHQDRPDLEDVPSEVDGLCHAARHTVAPRHPESTGSEHIP